MAIYTFKEVADLTGYTIGSISALTGASKGVLIKHDKGLIDMSIDKNMIWFEDKKNKYAEGIKPASPIASQRKKRGVKVKTTIKKGQKVTKSSNQVINEEKEPIEPKAPKLSEATIRQNQILEEKNALTISILKSKLKNSELQNARLEGDFIETGYALKLFKITSAEQNTAVIKSVQQMMNQVGLKYNIPANKIALEMNAFIPRYNKEMELCASKVVSKLVVEND